MGAKRSWFGPLAVSLMVPGVVAAQDVFGNVDGCAAYASGEKAGVPVFWVQGQRFEFGSNVCQIDNLEPVEDGVQQISLTCEGIGGRSDLDYMIIETDEPDLILIHPKGAPNWRQGLRRCP
ncbi:hypothetical protein KUV51_17440 [Tateyamaria omphalii]|uniref:hypothetical protein n=1 Tax=Tateyamaria omphalii TaxID=299262 RepID=UPI001C99837A|nr:hypothetical protein [Tateyamaria omphalii]MBY5934795.1 hypothetical protein [Tateyamaria omphalii]